jgi:hypothetical protein
MNRINTKQSILDNSHVYDDIANLIVEFIHSKSIYYMYNKGNEKISVPYDNIEIKGDYNFMSVIKQSNIYLNPVCITNINFVTVFINGASHYANVRLLIKRDKILNVPFTLRQFCIPGDSDIKSNSGTIIIR